MQPSSPPDWQLRAEEYRTIADSMSSEHARQSFNLLAQGCELLGGRKLVSARSATVDYLARAAECRSFAKTLRSASAREALERVAAQWIALADRAF